MSVRGKTSFETYCNSNDKSFLLEEWDYDSNVLLPSEISYGSHKEVSWICKKGHRFKKDIHSRLQGVGCSICSGINFKRRNLLFKDYPELIKELDNEINTYEEVKNVTCASTKKIAWICPKGHKYYQSPSNRTKSKGCPCPICDNREALYGFNDLETWCKENDRNEILEDWDNELNDFLPRDITFGSSKNCYFICHICGYKWKTRLNARTLQKTGCYRCSKRMSSSFPEQIIYFYIKKYFPDAINGDRKILKGRELDIFIPSCNIAIEYDGETWHKNLAKDMNKDMLCREKNIVLYRIREDNTESNNNTGNNIYTYKYQDWEHLNKIIIELLNNLGIEDTDINIKRDEYRIKEQYYILSLKDSLKSLYPDIAKEWHPTKNGNISPDQVLPETHDSYYWLCPKCGYTYKAMVKNRVRMKSGCPKCGRKIASAKQMIKVKNITTGEIFDNVSEAAKKYNVGKAGIGACCRGITKTSNGYEWCYIDKDKISRYRKKSGKSHRRIVNIDTCEVYETMTEAILKTGIQNISACCRGLREKAGGYRWKYED